MRISFSGGLPSRVEVILIGDGAPHHIALDGGGAGLTVNGGRSIGLSSSPLAGGSAVARAE